MTQKRKMVLAVIAVVVILLVVLTAVTATSGAFKIKALWGSTLTSTNVITHDSFHGDSLAWECPGCPGGGGGGG